jgi:hypothetical protein
MNRKQSEMKAAAERNGGFMTYAFSQGQLLRWGSEEGPDQGKLYKKVRRGSGVMGGACYAISAFWVVFHAKQGQGDAFTQDRSVWDYLFDEDGLRLNAAMNIVVEHRESSRIGQTVYFDQTLKKFGILRRGNIVTGANLEAGGSVAGRSGHNFLSRGRAIGKWITQKGEGYRTISLRRATGGGHAVAAWVGQDVAFMDPNYGEFWFPNHEAFHRWFVSFWRTSSYPYTEIVVRSYAPAI